MRWERLFDDLEAQYEAAETAEFAAEVADRSRREVASLQLADRLVAVVGGVISVRVLGIGTIEGGVVSAGPDWVLIEERSRSEAMVPFRALLGVAGLSPRSGSPTARGVVARRWDFRFALRGLVRDRSAVTLGFIDGATVFGTIDRVGADFLEVAEHPSSEARRSSEIQLVRTVPLTAVAAIRRG